MEVKLLITAVALVAPKNVGARKSCVPAEFDFHRGRKPAQAEPVFLRCQKGGFRKAHLAGDVLHPFRGAWLGQQADRGRIAGEGPCSEGVNLIDTSAHQKGRSQAGCGNRT